MSAKIIAVANQKGGVGKTTTTLNFGYALSLKGYKVLLIDFDPQSNLSISCGIINPDDLDTTIYTLMECVLQENKFPPKDKYIRKTGNMYILPSSIELSGMEMLLTNTMSREYVLSSILKPLREDYDYILIDCTPSLGMLTINALTAASSVIITTTPQYLSAVGINLLFKTITKIQRKLNPDLKIEGLLFTMFKEHTNISKKLSELVNDSFGEYIKIFSTNIPNSVKVDEANLSGTCIIEYEPQNKVSQAYLKFTDEILNKED